jgi:hypothetical protein
MIQRIQSVYLLLVAIFSFMLFLNPIGTCTVTSNDGKTYEVQARYDSIVQQMPEHEVKAVLYVFVCIIFFIFLVSLISIFLFKKRRVQLFLGNLNMLAILLLLVGAFWYADYLIKQLYPGATILEHYGFGVYIPVAMLLLNWLANKAIKKDEALVRAADRIR